MWGTVCHLCGREGADTADHLITRKQIRDLGLDIDEFDPENLRPAHARCNKSRGARPVTQRDDRVVVADGW